MSIILSARVMSGTAAASRPSQRSVLGIAIASALIFGALICRPQPALAQFSQQGPALIGTGAIGYSEQGSSVALSADGNTAVVGGSQDNSSNLGAVGAAWIYVRNGGTWSQQGQKLTGDDAVDSNVWQGQSVALSADGNTALVGGYQDNGGIGAAWVYTRSSSGGWSQQGPKLVGTGYSGLSGQAVSVALSADGNTALLGAWGDSGYIGAAWVFVRHGFTWSQQGSKLVGSGYSGTEPQQGYSVALSADGNTALIGGPYDNPSNNSGVGAAWVFTRSGTTWSQQGSKLVGKNPAGTPTQGFSVSLSADGDTAILGGPGENSNIGASWIFVRSGTTWSQQGPKLVGSGVVGSTVFQGSSVALSATGNIAIVGGYADNSYTGAAWIFTRSGSGWTQSGSKLIGTNSANGDAGYSVAMSAAGTTAFLGGIGLDTVGQAWAFAAPNFNPTATNDFNGDGTSDILWRDGSGDTTAWFLNNGNVTSGTGLGNVPTAWSVVASRDFDSNGSSDMLWRDTAGDTTMWLMSGGSIAQGTSIGNIPTAWSVAGTGDFNGDGKGDILWHDTGGDTTVWFMNGGTITGSTGLGTVPTIWSVAGVGDFNGDGTSDILWHDIYGDVSVWEMSAGSIKQGMGLGNVATNWSIVGTGDFNSDGTSDILWRDTAGDVMIWLIHNGVLLQQSVLANVATTWSVAETGDFNGDGYSDILWIDTSGNLMIWFMNGLNVTGVTNFGNVGTVWTVQGSNAD